MTATTDPSPAEPPAQRAGTTPAAELPIPGVSTAAAAGATTPASPPSPMAPPTGALAAPPDLSGVAKTLSDASRTAFRYGNRFAMVPAHRAGLAAWMGNPLTGWQCLVTTIGRRSGLPRHTPLGYLVMDGAAWVVAGYGPSTLWYRNVLDDPRVDLLLPGRPPIAARATEERDPSVRARIIPPLCRSMALPAAMSGIPSTWTDERILASVAYVPLVRIVPADGTRLAAGPEDPGGLGWTWRQALALGVTLLAIRALRRMRGA
jgi:deazaflavin-dependent oxidoreductase (nitroreductase family)